MRSQFASRSSLLGWTSRKPPRCCHRCLVDIDVDASPVGLVPFKESAIAGGMCTTMGQLRAS